MSRSKAYIPLLFVVSLGSYVAIGYGINRAHFGIFISLYTVLFASYVLMVQAAGKRSGHLMGWAVAAAILFRVALIPAFPALSDDVFRFIWDGNLFTHGMNPFAHMPQYYMQRGLPEFLSSGLYDNLNSPEYYTVYPPVSQFIYALSAALAGVHLTGNVVVMKLIMLSFEAGSIGLMKKLLDHFGRSPKWLLLYALNPLVILELSGNLHFEGVMIFLLLAAYYLFLTGRGWWAAACFVLAVNTKLVPLLLLPYLLFSLGWRRSAGLLAALLAGTAALHLPFLEGAFWAHFTQSLGLYFQSFEFNASIYYVVRWVGYQVKGYNIIQTAAPVLALTAAVLIAGVARRCRSASLRNLPAVCIVSFALYYLLSTTVHPWYVTPLLALVPLAGFWFPLAWSALIPLSYVTYTTVPYNESLWLVALEYGVVIAVAFYDYRNREKQPAEQLQSLF